MKSMTSKRGNADLPVVAIWTLRIDLVFGLHAEGPWRATLEIDSAATLEDLHFAIQQAVQFDNDHMYMFYIARTLRSRDRIAFEDDDGSLYETTLAELFPLPKDRRLYYWFDFGDDWKFSISKTRTAPQIPKQGRRYPRLVETQGDRPEQYPPID